MTDLVLPDDDRRVERDRNVPVSPLIVPHCPRRSEQVEQKLGASPGPGFLMSLAIEHEDALEFVDLFCREIIAALRETRAAA